MSEEALQELIKERDDYRDTVDVLLKDCEQHLKRIKELESQTPSGSSSRRKNETPRRDGGLNQADLCLKFGIDPANIARTAKKAGLTAQSFLEQKTGWRYDTASRYYYPPE